MNKALLSSIKMDWCTPQDYFDQLNDEFGFVLDVAATEKTAKCRKYYTPEMDGLAQDWDCGGPVFCNPPYGREIGKWVKKAHDEAQNGVTVVLLIPARTDTSYFHDYILGKANIRFVRGRLQFTDSDGKPCGPAPFPSMLVIYNSRAGSHADVVPVVRGNWLLRRAGAGHYWECSVCHTNPCIYVTEHTKFCPNCGARMDEDCEK